MAKNRVIGRDNQLPWRLPADLKHFKDLTVGKSYIVGRKTWDSVGRPLPGRDMIVISRKPNLSLDGAVVVPTLDEALAVAKAHAKNEEVMVGGGTEIFRLALPRADRIYLTVIDRVFEGDAIFPQFTGYELTAREPHLGEGDLDFEFQTWDRAPRS